MLHNSARLLLLLLLALGCVQCGTEDGYMPQQAPVAPTVEDGPPKCPEHRERLEEHDALRQEASSLQRLSDHLLHVVSDISGLPALAHVPVSEQTLSQQDAHQQALAEKVGSEDGLVQWQRGQALALFAFGLSGPANHASLRPVGKHERSSEPASKAVVLGFYDTDRKAFFIRDDIAEEQREGLLGHELMHALQDQSYDLAALTRASLPNIDAFLAVKAVIEGQAMVAETMLTRRNPPPPVYAQLQTTRPARLALRQTTDVSLALFPLMMRQGVDGKVEQKDQALSRQPNLIFFPYIEGQRFFDSLLDGDWGGDFPYWVQQTLQRPPKSTREILHPEVYLGAPGVVASEPVFLTQLTQQPAWPTMWVSPVGEYLTAAYLWQASGDRALATHLLGDRLAVFGAKETERAAVAWVSHWDSDLAAARFARAAQRQQTVAAQRAARAHMVLDSWVHTAGRRVGVFVALDDRAPNHHLSMYEALQEAFFQDLATP